MMKKTLALAVLILGMIVPNLGSASPIARFSAQGITITLTDEDCKLKEVINLPKKAVWVENGKEVEGRFGYSAPIGIVTFYFTDKTVASVPAQLFERITGA